MKRFLLFSSQNYYPSVGFDDFVQDFDSIDEAKSFYNSDELEGGDVLQVVDTLLRITQQSEWDDNRGEYGAWRARSTGPCPTLWTHTKRAGLYVQDRRGKLQLRGPDDMSEVVGYTDVIGGHWWCRKAAEFEDGCFVQIDIANREQLAALFIGETARSLIATELKKIMTDPKFASMIGAEG